MRPGDPWPHEEQQGVVGVIVCCGLAHDLLEDGKTAIVIDVKYPGLPIERNYYEAARTDEPSDPPER